MTISKVIARLNDLKPNMLSDGEIIRLVNDVEMRIQQLLGMEIAPVTDKNEELLAPVQHEGVYFDYVSSKIDFFNSNIDGYALTSRQFNASMMDLRKYYVTKGLTPSVSKPTDYY